MNNQYLDKILAALLKKEGEENEDVLYGFVGGSEDLYDMALDLLNERKLIEYGDTEEDGHIYLTGIGSHFILNGGFVHEAKLRNTPLIANRLAKWAIVISILAFVASAIAIFLQYKSR